MSVHYKFKSTLNFDTITFDGLQISVADLKKSIISQKRLGKITDFDLQITNAQTKEEYVEESALIPKNTSLIIARIPLAQQSKKSWEAPPEKPSQARSRKQDSGVSLDISKMKGSEEEKIREMMLQSTADYDPKSYQRTKGHYQTGEVPASYRCNKCKKGGHWIKNCPLGSSKEHAEVKRTTGIPRSFRDKDPLLEQEKMEPLPIAEIKTAIPEDLICSICNDLFTDAVMIPCCGSSFCDDCVRTALLESEDNECPDCGEKGSSPGALIPNRFIRNSVNSFKNETGYTAAALKKAAEGNVPNKKPVAVEEVDQNIQEEPISAKAGEDTLTAEQNADAEDSHEPVPEAEAKDGKGQEEKVAEKEEESSTEKGCAEPIAGQKDEVHVHGEVESDFEDNIVVTVPPSQVESQTAVFRERPSYNDRRIQHVKPLELEAPSQKISKISPMIVNNNDNNSYGCSLPMRNIDWERSKYEQHGYKDPNKDMHGPNKIGCISTYPNPGVPNPIKPPVHMMPNYPFCDPSQRPIRPLNMHEMDNVNRGNMYQPPNRMLPGQGPPVQGPPMGQYPNHYGPMLSRPTHGYNQFMPPDIRNDCAGYGPPRPMPTDPNMGMMPSSRNLASVYQGVAVKIGTGIIDDPLSVFNRIMKEKEKRKEVRRRSPDLHHHSRTDHPMRNRFRVSPYDYEKPRERKDRERERERSIERERERRREYGRGNERKVEKIYPRRRRSNSFSDKSRSRSRSHTPGKRRSISPHKRRSRSYKRPNDEKYHRNEKPRHEQRILGPRHLKEATPPLSMQLLDRVDRAPPHRDFYDTALEYEQPPPPGFELLLSAPHPPRHENEVPLFSPLRNVRDPTPTRSARQSQRDRSPSKGHERYVAERRRPHSRSVTPKGLSTVAKYDKREIERNTVDERHNSSRGAKRDRSRTKDRSQKVKIDEESTEKRRNNRLNSSGGGGSDSERHNKVQIVGEDAQPEFAKRHEADWKLNDSDRMSLDSHKEIKRDKVENKRDKKFGKERKKRRKEKTQRKKNKKEKREKRESADKVKGNDKEYKKEQSSSRDGNQTVTPVMTPTVEAEEQAVAEESQAVTIHGDDGNMVDTPQVAANGATLEEPQQTAQRTHTINNSKSENGTVAISRRVSGEKKYENINEPELSKWERDEAPTLNFIMVPSVVRNNSREKDTTRPSSCRRTSHERRTITTEVLRKAENVIFAKAENVIRPLEAKKTTHGERHVAGGGAFENIQIVVPLVEEPLKRRRSHSSDALHNNGNSNVKDRLGSKIVTHNAFAVKRASTNHPQKARNSLDESSDQRERMEEPKHRNKFREVRERERDERDLRDGRDRERERERERSGRDLKSVGVVQQLGARRNPRNAFASPPRGDSRRHRSRDDVARDDKRNNGRGVEEKYNKDNKAYGPHKPHGNQTIRDSGPRGGGEEERNKFERYPREQRDRERQLAEKHKRNEHHKHGEQRSSSQAARPVEARKPGPHTQTGATQRVDAGAGSSSGSSDSDSEAAKSNDHSKRKKKHKTKKDKKRAKRSTSAESCGTSVPGAKQMRNKKKIKSNRKNKKNKK